MEKVPVYKTYGIILKKADLGQTDRLLTIYTEKFGKILVRAKGVGKKESKLKSLIEPFNIYEFMLAKSKTIDVLANSWPQKEFVNLRVNFETLMLAIYFCELIDKLIPAPERDPNIWTLVTKAMEALNEINLKSSFFFVKREEQFSFFRESREGSFLLKLKTAFEEKLLELLGHPTFLAHGKITAREKINYLQSLAGEEIKTEKFLSWLK